MLLNAKAKYANALQLAFIAAACNCPCASVVLITVKLDADMLVSKVLPKAQEILLSAQRRSTVSLIYHKIQLFHQTLFVSVVVPLIL